MEKVSSFEMDLDEWELLPDDGFLNGKINQSKDSPYKSKGGVQIDYFKCRSDPSDLLFESVEDLTMIKTNWQPPTVPSPIKPKNPVVAEDISSDVLDFVKEIKEVKVVSPLAPKPMIMAEDRETSYMKSETQEFADKKTVERRAAPNDSADDHDDEKKSSEGVLLYEEGEKKICSVEKGRCCWNGFGVNIWRWRFTGIGALCSIGVAAATICIFILGGHQRQKQQQMNQKIQLQICPNEKNLKQVVQHATRLNQAMSAARGLPVSRANISFGGYYDGF